MMYLIIGLLIFVIVYGVYELLTATIYYTPDYRFSPWQKEQDDIVKNIIKEQYLTQHKTIKKWALNRKVRRANIALDEANQYAIEAVNHKKNKEFRRAIRKYNLAVDNYQLYPIALRIMKTISFERDERNPFPMRFESELSDVFASRAECHNEREEYDAAIRDYHQALCCFERKKYYEALGEIYMKIGKYKEAVSNWETAVYRGSEKAKKLLDLYGELEFKSNKKKSTSKTILFFDTETSGLPKNYNAPKNDLNNWPRMVQIAWILFDENENRLSDGNCIIKPEGFYIPELATEIHGISTDRALKEGVDIKVVLEEFEILARRATFLVAHNIKFDERVLGAEYIRINKSSSLDNMIKICTMDKSTLYCKIKSGRGYRFPELSELHYKLFATNFVDAHNATKDVEITAKCFWKLRQLGIVSTHGEKEPYKKPLEKWHGDIDFGLPF